MNREEATSFYHAKHTRATSLDSRVAYHYILSSLDLYQDIEAAKSVIAWDARHADSKARRAIYRKALKELNDEQ